MFASNNRISKRQTMRLLTFDLLGYSALVIPSVLARVAGTDGIFSLLLGIAAGFIYLFLLKKVLAQMTSSYSDYIKTTCGTFVGGIIKIGYILYFLLLSARVAAIFAELVTKELLEEQFELVLVIILILTCYGAIGGIEGRARVYEILFLIVLLPLLVMMLATIPAMDADYWMPIFVATKAGVLRGAYDTFLGSSILFLLPFLTKYVEKRELLYDSGKKALFLTGGILCFLYMILLGIFGAAALATMDYPAVTMMSRVQITGGFLKRVDAIMFGIWFFTLYALLNSLIFFGGGLWAEFIRPVVKSILKRLRTEEDKSEKEEKLLEKMTARFAILIEIVAVFFLANELYGSQAAKNTCENFFVYIGTPFIVIVPLVLLILSNKRAKRMAAVATGMLLLLLSACSPTEVEDREFPVLLKVDKEESFARDWLNSLQQGNKKVDYNHLKVVMISKEFLENDVAMTEMLHILKQNKNVPLNAYVVTTSQFEELTAVEEKLDEPLGDYVEKLLENSDAIKKETFPTIGMLYQEEENQIETLFIPVLSLVKDKPEITSYMAYKQGEAVGEVRTETALLAFFINNQLEEYVLQLGINDFVRLFHAENELSFEEHIEESGLIRKRVNVLISCDGEIIYEKVSGEGEEVTRWFEAQLTDYMKKTAAKELERGIDVTNSRKKLGGAMRSWYEKYRETPKAYEEDIEIVFDVKIRWIND